MMSDVGQDMSLHVFRIISTMYGSYTDSAYIFYARKIWDRARFDQGLFGGNSQLTSPANPI